MTDKKLQKVLKKHALWLSGDSDGEKAVLVGADLRGKNLSGKDLRFANLHYADLRYVNLSKAQLNDVDLRGAKLNNIDLRGANLNCANLTNAKLNNANLTGADLTGADLVDANLRGAELSHAKLVGVDFTRADLIGANLSGAEGLLSSINFMEDNFERTENGYIAYKTFGGLFPPLEKWKIEPGFIIEENVNFDRCDDCGCGINVAPIQWVKDHYKGDIWKVLIRWEWLTGVCIPYNSDGKIRCERVELIEIVK